MRPARVTIFVVEDEESISLLFKSTLEAEGYVVERCAHGSEALDRLARGGIDLVLLDQHLPDTLGTDVLAELRRRGDHPPVVIVTASSDVELAVAALKAGAMDYLVKDVELNFLAMLPRTVVSALDRASLEQRNRALVRELRRKEERLRSIFECSPIGIALLDAAGRIVTANRAGALLFGLAHPSELEGFRLLAALGVGDLEQAFGCAEALQRPVEVDFSTLGGQRLPRMRDTGTLQLELALTPLRADGEDGAVRAMVQLQDVTDRVHPAPEAVPAKGLARAVVLDAGDSADVVIDAVEA